VALGVLAAGVAAAPAQAQTAPCREAQGGRCGTVTVPVDRAAPGAGTMKVAFELYPARRRARRLGTILAIPDGPGLSATAVRDVAFAALQGARARFDLLLVDRRGTGKSQPIVCRDLQRGRGPVAAGVAACGAQLGDAAGRFGAADVAQDIEAVRAKLGVPRLDVVGTAYGAVDALAYAVRNPDRVRSLVLASPVTPIGRDPFNATQVPAFLRAVGVFCARSRPCAATGDDPRALVTALIQRLRAAPVQGRAPGRDGRLRAVTLDEAALAEMARNTRGDMNIHGELTAAARALLAAGDAAPLLRLAAAAMSVPGDRDFGPAGGFVSMGGLAASFCADAPAPWDVRSPRAARIAQAQAALAARGPDAFAPFSPAAWTAGLFGAWDDGFELVSNTTSYRVGPCVDWPAPARPEPAIPPGAALPAVPALVLASDTSVHTPQEDVDALAAQLPRARRVVVSGMDHVPAVVEPCVAAMIARFVARLDPGRSCAPDPGGPWVAPGSFPRTAADAQPARVDPRGRNAVGALGRRIAAVAVATLVDAYYHGNIDVRRTPGLRGGQVAFTVARRRPVGRIVLHGARFARDVAVRGGVRIDFARGQRFRGRLTARGGALGRRRATLTVDGNFYSRPDRPVRVRGRIAGRRAALLVDVY
jgi:pimeloyl-ACP methyl ester carboxylesterase